MSKKTHKKELERARAKRRAEAASQQRQRRALIAVAVIVIAAIVVGLVLVLTGGDEAATPTIEDGEGSATETASEQQTSGEETEGEATEGATDPQAAVQPVDAEPCDVSGAEAPSPSATPRESPPEMQIDPEASYTATLETTCGTITLDLDAAAAPETVNNFVTLARDDYYDGAPFHRVIENFMIQGGDPTGTGRGFVDDPSNALPGYTIPDELEATEQIVAENAGYPRGVIAMANTGQPNSGGAQFFIVEGRNTGDEWLPYPLPPTYTIFGRVTEGMDIVDRIAKGPAEGDLAIDPVQITDVQITES